MKLPLVDGRTAELVAQRNVAFGNQFRAHVEAIGSDGRVQLWSRPFCSFIHSCWANAGRDRSVRMLESDVPCPVDFTRADDTPLEPIEDLELPLMRARVPHTIKRLHGSRGQPPPLPGVPVRLRGIPAGAVKKLHKSASDEPPPLPGIPLRLQHQQNYKEQAWCSMSCYESEPDTSSGSRAGQAPRSKLRSVGKAVLLTTKLDIMLDNPIAALAANAANGKNRRVSFDGDG